MPVIRYIGAFSLPCRAMIATSAELDLSHHCVLYNQKGDIHQLHLSYSESNNSNDIGRYRPFLFSTEYNYMSVSVSTVTVKIHF